MVKKNFDDMCNRLYTILACDRRRTDGQASCHGTVRAMRMHRAVKSYVSRTVSASFTVKYWRNLEIGVMGRSSLQHR